MDAWGNSLMPSKARTFNNPKTSREICLDTLGTPLILTVGKLDVDYLELSIESLQQARTIARGKWVQMPSPISSGY